MKTVIVTVKYRVSDQFYNEEMREGFVGDIQSGKFQRESQQDFDKKKSLGLKWVKASVEVINK